MSCPTDIPQSGQARDPQHNSLCRPASQSPDGSEAPPGVADLARSLNAGGRQPSKSAHPQPRQTRTFRPCTPPIQGDVHPASPKRGRGLPAAKPRQPRRARRIRLQTTQALCRSTSRCAFHLERSPNRLRGEAYESRSFRQHRTVGLRKGHGLPQDALNLHCTPHILRLPLSLHSSHAVLYQTKDHHYFILRKFLLHHCATAKKI